jgi:hypothetical protein
MANLPFAQQARLTTAAEALQPAAAAGEADIANRIASIGQGMAGTGVDIGRMGTTLAGMGQQGLQNVIGDILQKMHLNQLDPGALGTLSQVLGLLPGFGQLLSGAGGALKGQAGGAAGILGGLGAGFEGAGAAGAAGGGMGDLVSMLLIGAGLI